MDIFTEIERREHEQIVLCSDKRSHLRAVIAIHNTTLGPTRCGFRAE